MKITINENLLKQIVLESVKRIIKESVNENFNNGDANGGDVNNNVNFEPTEMWAKQKYDEFNKKYFNGFLPKCRIKVGPLKETDGTMKAGYMKMTSTGGFLTLDCYYSERYGYMKINRDTINKTLKPVIAINSNYSAPEKSIENTLIHEMCHFYTWFNPDGSIRIPDKDNNLHGSDFMEIASKIQEISGGEIMIKQLIDAEEMSKYTASSTFNKDGYKICLGNYNGKYVYWYTKDNFWIGFGMSLINANEIKVTDDAQLLMLLKRTKHAPCRITLSQRAPKMNAYALDSACESIKSQFEKANFITVNKQNCDEYFQH